MTAINEVNASNNWETSICLSMLSSDQGHFQLSYVELHDSDSNPIEFVTRDQCSGHIIYMSGSELIIDTTPPLQVFLSTFSYINFAFDALLLLKFTRLVFISIQILIEANRVTLVQLSYRGDDLCAILFADNLLKIYHGSTCVSQYMFESVQILAVYWIHTSLSSLLVITTTALLFYNVDVTGQSLNLVRAHTRPTVASWFLCSRRVLLAADDRNQFDLWIMRSASPRKTLRFGIGRLSDATPIQIQRQVHLIDLYEHPTLIFFDENAGRLHVYLIQRSALVPTHSFDLFHTGPARLFVSDDVLVVFVEGRPQLPLLFDTRALNAPLISPLPLSLPIGWTILQPDLIVAGNKIIILSLRLDGMIDSWGISDPEPLLHFLTRRSNAESYIERVLSDQILQERLSDQLCRSLSIITSVDSKRRTTISQSHIASIFRRVTGCVPGRYLESICYVYMQKLLEAHISPEYEIIEIIVDVLMENERYHQFQQCLQYHMFPDSGELGVRLCCIGRDLNDAIYQLGLDMLYRSGTYQLLIEQILNCSTPHQIILVLRFVSAHPQLITQLDILSSNQLLQMTLKAGDKALFHNVYLWIQNRNLALHGDKNFVESDRCDELVKQLIDKYGEIPQ